MAAQDETSALRFGNYEVLSRPDGKPDELGRGGFGRTYRARHAFLGTEVALKVILDRLAFDEAAKKRFLKEAQEHAKLSHPGIARITDFGEAEGTFFYAMELCRDGDLKEYVKKRGALPPAEALALIRQTAEALQFAHSRGIVHRDIKPSNLLLVMSDDGPPHVKLIDFGLVRRMAREADETADQTASQWSPVFASPEQIREHALDERTDIFSLGMTAWYLMAGSGPVDGSTQEIIQDRLSDVCYAARLPAALTGPARAAVAKMLEKTTASRFRNCAELLDALREASQATAAAPRRLTFAERFILQPSGRSYLGEVFRGTDRERDLPVRITKVYCEHDATLVAQAAEKARKLAGLRPPGLMPVLEMTEFPEGWVVVEEDHSGTALAEVLRREGTVSLTKIAAILWDAATGIDALCECGASPGPLEQAILTSVPPAGTVDWSAVQIYIPVQLAEPESDWTADADVTAAMPAASPLQAYASLLYLAVGGRQVRAQAYYSAAECIPIPGLNSNANRTLAACVSAESHPAGCIAFLRTILADEGLPGDSIARRAKERAQHATTRKPERPVPPPPLSAAQQTEALQNIESFVHAAKEASEQTLRVRLRQGMDETGLSRHQLEARRWAKEAAACKQQAGELAAAHKFDAAAVQRLTDSAAAAAAAVARELAAVRALAADQEADTRSARTQTAPIVPPPPPPLPVEERQEPFIHLQPVIPLPPPRKSRAAAVMITVLLLAGAGAGGWIWYDKNRTVTPKPDVVDNKPETGGTKTTLPSNGKAPEPPPPPPPPPKVRQAVVTFTGDLPQEDGDISFKGIATPPTPVSGKDRLEYTFTLAPGAAIPEAIINPDRFGSVRTGTGTDHIEYRLTKNRPPATIRLKGITARDAKAVTIGGIPGSLDGDVLVFEHAAQADGAFKLDVTAWQITDKVELLSPGVWEATMTAPLFQVSFEVPGTAKNPWRTVLFTPVNRDALPPLLDIVDPNNRILSQDEKYLSYNIEGPAPEPIALPAGDYTLTWKADFGGPQERKGDKFTVHPDRKNGLPLPAPETN